MKKILIVVNLCLFLLALIFFFANITQPATKAKTVKKSPVKTSGKKSSAPHKSAEPAESPAQLPSVEESVNKITGIDVFSTFRSPLASVRTGRTEMALVGVFMIGDVRGAIIKQTGSNRQVNPYIAQMMAMAGPPPGNFSPQNNNNQRGSGRTGRQGSRSGSGFAGGPPAGGPPGGGFPSWNPNGMSGRNSASKTIKQYVRVGETMSNGYTLTAVTRTRATLVRGNDKLELELMDPSKNRVASGNSAPRLNSFQQFQQAQMFMQSQMLRTMQRMEQRNSSGGPGGPGNGNGNRGRGR